ncbi:MAG: hypothetical protein DME54_08575, partial [Verrucomicrobia bacterium]
MLINSSPITLPDSFNASSAEKKWVRTYAGTAALRDHQNPLRKTTIHPKKEKDQAMKSLIKLKTTTLLVIPLVLACFALLPRAQAAEQPALLPAPPPDGGYAGFNTAEGFQALLNVNTATGVFNSAFGAKALQADTTGAHNTALGGQALLHNNGSYNTAVGENALVFNTSGSFNMALGQGALANNLGGSSSTAMGFQALNKNIDGFENEAVGFQALFSNTHGTHNTAIGTTAMLQNTTGSGNVAVGDEALRDNQTFFDNTAVGQDALVNCTSNANIALGFGAGANITTGGLNIDIGNEGNPGEHNTIRIGRDIHHTTFIAGISGATVPGGVAVIVDANGHLGTMTSSARFKDEIKPMDKASEAILALKPVTFHYKKELDPDGIPQFGLVAEEVEKVDPDLVARDAKGKVYTVRYEAVNAM